MTDIKVGVQLQPQACEVTELRTAWTAADQIGADSIWVWDHFYPLFGDDERHFEGWTLLAAMAVETSNAQIGPMVGCNSYRNPELTADMARTIDHLSGGRFVLGIGSGWFERDYTEYGYEFGTAIGRLNQLDTDLDRMRSRIDALTPGPMGDLPILIGGAGEKVTLRIVAEKAQSWNTFGPPENYAHKNSVLDEWCAKVGRDPSEVERTVCIQPNEIGQADALVEAGATHLIVMIGAPFDLDPLQQLIDWRPSGG